MTITQEDIRKAFESSFNNVNSKSRNITIYTNKAGAQAFPQAIEDDIKNNWSSINNLEPEIDERFTNEQLKDITYL